MERLAHHSNWCWVSSSGECLRFGEWRTDETLSTRSTWYVWIPARLDDALEIQSKRGLTEIEQRHEGDGCMEAYEHHGGALFEEFCEVVIGTLQGRSAPIEGKAGVGTMTEISVIVSGTLRQVWDILKQQRDQWEDRQELVMLYGPFSKAGGIDCLLKMVPDPAVRIPDESDFGKIRAKEMQGAQDKHTSVIFRKHNFQDPVLFWRMADELVESMKEAGLEPDTSPPSRGEADHLPPRRVRSPDYEKPSDGQPYDTATIRDLLLAAFTAEELGRFCQERSLLRSLTTNFGPKYNLNDMIDEVIDFCETRRLWKEFLNEVEQYNPKQYNRFTSRLRVSAHAANGVKPGVPRESVASISPPTEKSRTQIFLCYARRDRERVEALYQELSDAGFKPWMDTKNILPGEKWKVTIERAIRQSDFFLSCLSANSVNRRGFIQKEIRQALDIWQEMLDSDIYLIPVRIEKCKIPDSLLDFQCVDLFEDSGWTDLVRAIRVGMKRRQIHGMESETLKSRLETWAHQISALERFVFSQDYDAFDEDVRDEQDELEDLRLSYMSLQEELRFTFGEDYDPLRKLSE